MSRRDDSISLRQMRDHAREALSFSAGKTRTDLDTARMLNLSLVRLLEIIGEAAGRVTAATQARHPDIPWALIVGMRNRLVHGYDTIDLDIVWEVVQHELPPLMAQLDAILNPP